MKPVAVTVDEWIEASKARGRAYARLRATLTDDPETHAAEPLAAEPGRPVAEPDRDDLDAVPHP